MGGGGGRGGGLLHGQQPVSHITWPRLSSTHSPTPTSTPGGDTPASPSAWTQHGEQQIPVISHRSIGVERSARGCSRRMERSLDVTGQLSPASSWTAPCQPAVVPPWTAILTGCMGIRDHPKKADCNNGTRQPQTKSSKKTTFKTGVLECPDNDDRPLYKPARHQGSADCSALRKRILDKPQREHPVCRHNGKHQGNVRRHQEGTRTYPEQDRSPQIFYRGSYHG